MSRIGVVGSGIAGLGAAYVLDGHREVVLYEAADRLGGHANTVTVDDPNVGPLGVDTGFIVHNDRNYPNLVRLFEELGVPVQNSEMSFGVDHPGAGVAYRATNPLSLLANPANAKKAGFWRMLADIPRFWRQANRLLDHPDPSLSLSEFLRRGRYSDEFVEWHLIPMGSAIWSADPTTFGQFPAVSLFSFLRNHGLLSLGNRPQWRTVVGGSRTYVDAIAKRVKGDVRLGDPVQAVRRTPAGVEVTSAQGVEVFDDVVLACHSDQSLEILADASPDEKELLKGVEFQPNAATLHTDESVLPRQCRAQAAWNFRVAEGAIAPTVTYDLTLLQKLPGQRRYLVSLNMDELIDQDKVIQRFEYDHPVFNHGALASQEVLEAVSGSNHVYFAGAWAGHGFHEDGLRAALHACNKLGVTW